MKERINAQTEEKKEAESGASNKFWEVNQFQWLPPEK